MILILKAWKLLWGVLKNESRVEVIDTTDLCFYWVFYSRITFLLFTLSSLAHVSESRSFSVHLPFSEFVLSVYMTTTCMLLSFFLCWKNPFILLSDLLNWCAFPASISSRLNFSQINWIFCSHRSLTLKLSMSLRKLSQRIVFPLPSF